MSRTFISYRQGMVLGTKCRYCDELFVAKDGHKCDKKPKSWPHSKPSLKYASDEMVHVMSEINEALQE